ncbi:MAG TPA: hypothetical protein VFU31_30135 [Candidatus Binatia bacterium]|nr:hypothetical protein [Candidatus Binatia bacterium]
MKFHNPVLGYQAGDDFVAFFHAAAQGKIDPFILVVEGSIPNETINQEGYWAMNRIGDDRMANNQ